jgi:hypothetical protein
MKLLAIMRAPDGADVRPAIARHARGELEALWRLYRDGVVREMYSPGAPGAVLILEAASAAQASATLSELPLLSEGIMTLEMIELRPFSAIEMLFSAGERA